MGFITFKSLKILVAVGIICLCHIKDTHAQMQNAVMALEATNIQLTIVIPNNQLAISASYITIKHDRGPGHNLTDVLYLVGNDPKIKDVYSSKLTATYTNNQLNLQFKNVAASEAGSYKCYVEGSMTNIANCGQLLIIIRKPSPPTVTVLPSSSTVVGSRLQLVCNANTASLPPNHGLASEIWWYDQNGQTVNPSGSSQRVHINAQSQLVIEPLERVDRSRTFACVSADNTGDVSKRIMSETSAAFIVVPEYRPSLQDFKMNPSFQNGEVIVKKAGDKMSYTCDADCSPQCNITWMYKPSSGSTDYSELTALLDRRVLTLNVNRASEGLYQCKAENKHGSYVVGFALETLYLEAPSVYINEEGKTSGRVLEDTPVNLKCVFDSNPGPVVNWISPSNSILYTQKALGPDIVVDGGVSKRLYTSTHWLARLKCEDTGVYTCQGRNDISSGDGLMELVITCPPSSANIPGLELKEEYVWEISQPLRFQFVIRAFPAPNITQIVSSVNGVSRPEVIPNDIEITQTQNHDGKPYLTKFDFLSKRKLDRGDTDRVYTLTFQSPDFKKEFVFQIHLRGPPHEVENLTAVDVGHDSLILFWLPGFNGGEPQTFSVEHRVHDTSEQKSGMELYDESYSWTSALTNIADDTSGNWIEVPVGSLRSSTDYVVRVKATNALGNSVMGIKIKTAVAPASLGPGAICGIVFGVLFILAIIAVILVYFLVYRKRFGRDHAGVNRKPIVPERITALFRKDKHNSRQKVSDKPNGTVAPDEGPWARVRKLLKRDASGNSPDYIYVPPKDYIENDETGEYINTALSPSPRYSAEDNLGHAHASNNNTASNKTPDPGRYMNDDGLVYVEVDFPGDKKNKKKKDKKKKNKNEDLHKSNESVSYSDIDFSLTATKRKELEKTEQRQEEQESLNGDYENTNKQNKYADAGFGIGTTV